MIEITNSFKTFSIRTNQTFISKDIIQPSVYDENILTFKRVFVVKIEIYRVGIFFILFSLYSPFREEKRESYIISIRSSIRVGWLRLIKAPFVSSGWIH